MPSMRVVPTHMAANASLTSHRSTSPTARPARSSALGIATVGASPVRSGATPTDAQARTTASGSRPAASASAPVGEDQRGAAVVHAGRVAGGDAEAGDLGVDGLERGELLEAAGRAGGGARRRRRSWSCRRGGSPRAGRSRRRSCPSSMAAMARWCERNAQASISSRVTPASTAAFQPDGDRHVLVGGVGRVAVARRRPVGPVVGARHPPGPAGRGRRRLDAAGHDHAVHAGPDRGRGGRHRGQARGAVAVVGDAGHVLEAGLDRHVAGDVAAAVAGLAEDDVVDERGVDARRGARPRTRRGCRARTRRRRPACP